MSNDLHSSSFKVPSFLRPRGWNNNNNNSSSSRLRRLFRSALHQNKVATAVPGKRRKSMIEKVSQQIRSAWHNDICSIEDIVNLVPDAVCILNADKKMCYHNAQFDKIISYDPTNPLFTSYLLQESLDDFLDSFELAISPQNTMHVPFRVELLKLNNEATTRAHSESYEWELRATKSRKAVILIGREILSKHAAKIIQQNEQQSAKESLVRYQQLLDTKRMFTRCVCHEVRTPLSVILSGLYLLESICKEYNDSNVNEAIEDSKLSCRSASDIMQALLTYEELESKTLKIKPATVDIYTILEENMKPLVSAARQWDITLALEHNLFEQIFILADPNEFGFILRALAENAVKFTPNGGFVTVRLSIPSESELGHAKDDADPNKEWLRISVTDNGPGLSAKMQAELFEHIEKFTPTQNETEQGRGVTICVVHGIIKLHNGHLGVASDGEGKGSTYFIDIPIHDKVPCKELPRSFTVFNQGSFKVLSPSHRKKKSSLAKMRSVVKLGLFGRRKESGDSPSASISEKNGTQSTGVKKILPDHLKKIRLLMKAGLFENYRRFDSNSTIPHNVSIDGMVSKEASRMNNFFIFGSHKNIIEHKSSSSSIRNMGIISKSTLSRNTSSVQRGFSSFGHKLPSTKEMPFIKEVDHVDNAHNEQNDGGGASAISYHSISSVYEFSESSPNDEKSPEQRLRLLIVDDVPSCRKMLSRILVKVHCICDEAKDGEDAVEKVRVAMSEGFVYDGIFMDDSMPRMTGPHAARAIRALGYRNKIFGVTGNSLTEDVDAFLSHGADKVVIKPLRREDIDLLLQDIRDHSVQVYPD